MRIVNQNLTVRNILFSKPASLVYLIVIGIFIYKSILLLPIWITAKDKAIMAQEDYNKKIAQSEQKQELVEDSQTPMGKARYQKDFFNKLDDGENLIVLYGNEKEEIKNEETRKMFWWEEWKQNFIVWWKNL